VRIWLFHWKFNKGDNCDFPKFIVIPMNNLDIFIFVYPLSQDCHAVHIMVIDYSRSGIKGLYNYKKLRRTVFNISTLWLSSLESPPLCWNSNNLMIHILGLVSY
jgi:hypothetical protein